MRIAHLTASPFFGGPERQLLGLARSLPHEIQSFVVSFAERGLCEPFLQRLRQQGVHATALRHNAPQCWKAIQEVRQFLRTHHVDLLCCHGYKADLLGLPAARMIDVPIVSVSRGWTGASWKVRCYEALHRLSLWMMDQVVCVSEGQARRVRRIGLPPHRIRVIRNAVFTDRFGPPTPAGRNYLQSFFRQPPQYLIGSAGRFSPEKGFCQLIEAAAEVRRVQPRVGFLLFGHGPLRKALISQIKKLGLQDHFVLVDFCTDLDRWLPNFDVFTLPSYTEGLPNVVLEAQAARVPVVATSVGGTPEIIKEGQTGFLVPARHPQAMAQRILYLLHKEPLRIAMGESGYEHVCEKFTFEAQAQQYVKLFEELLHRKISSWTAPFGTFAPEKSSRAA